MTSADSLQHRKRFSLLKGGPAAAPGAEVVSGGSWIALHTALTLGAGHGLFLAFAVTRAGLPGLHDFGGMRLAPFVLFFLACVPAVPASYLLRARFVALPRRLQVALSGAAWAGLALAGAVYLARILGA